MLTQTRGDVVEIVDVGVRHGDRHHLHRCEPGREGAGVVLEQHREEALDGPEERAVDHHRPLTRAIRGGVLEVEALREVEVELDRRHLPRATDRVLCLHGDLRTVERRASLVEHEFKALLLGGLPEHLGRLGPDLVRTHGLLGIASRQLEVEVFETVVAEQVEDEREQLVELVGHLLARAVDVRVVLGEAARTGHPLDDAGLLVAVDRAELEEPQGQLAVGAATRIEDEVVHRAVHRLEVVVESLSAHGAIGVDLCVELHGRVHALGVPIEMTGLLEERRLRDVRGVDELVARLFMTAPRVVLHHAAHHPALRVEDRQTRADLLGEAEEVELRSELAVVALLGLLEEVEIGLELVLGGPGRAVDALQLLIGLVAEPIGSGGAHEPEGVGGDEARVWHVRASAQIAPAGRAGLGVDVVIDRELGPADLHDLGTALAPDEAQLERLTREFALRLRVGDDASREPLAGLHDLLHPLLEALEVLGSEGPLDGEVVVEAVPHRRPDPELGIREGVLHRLRKDMSGGVTEDGEALGGIDAHGLDDIAITQCRGQVAQLAVDPSDDNPAPIGDDVASGSPFGDLGRPRSIGGDDGDGRHGSSPVRRCNSRGSARVRWAILGSNQ